MSDKQLILLSGGLDSVVLAGLAAEEGGELFGIYLSFGMDSSLGELQAARRAAARLRFPLEVVDIQGVAKMLLGYAPLEWIRADEADIVDPTPARERLPSGYHVLLSIATYYAQVREIQRVKVGLLREQAESRAGLSSFLEQWSPVIRALNDSGPELRVEAPLLDKCKKDIVLLGMEGGIELGETWSCIWGGSRQCGTCVSCRARRSAFDAAGCQDPTRYLND